MERGGIKGYMEIEGKRGRLLERCDLKYIFIIGLYRFFRSWYFKVGFF